MQKVTTNACDSAAVGTHKRKPAKINKASKVAGAAAAAGATAHVQEVFHAVAAVVILRVPQKRATATSKAVPEKV